MNEQVKTPGQVCYEAYFYGQGDLIEFAMASDRDDWERAAIAGHKAVEEHRRNVESVDDECELCGSTFDVAKQRGTAHILCGKCVDDGAQ